MICVGNGYTVQLQVILVRGCDGWSSDIVSRSRKIIPLSQNHIRIRFWAGGRCRVVYMIYIDFF